ncbi:hypothetical protein SCHPADRAFT_1001877 [Schizopora paradoxa]|uniref:F-box domain-containing protein n=1 Tax=Schizopora paradoxa TaxID=27342 RepID=A0A0H2R721_9AGAM|nr:hypothetical protein SCHPADRAFT_1001877 [Schizopora paradoxa]
MDMDVDVVEDVGISPPWPLEIWLKVLSYLDAEDLKNISFTSSFYHNVAAKFLFRDLTLRFGRWQSEEDRLDEVEDEETERRNSERSLDVLLCLSTDVVIAGAVMSLTVFAFSRIEHALVFECHHIQHVLPKLKSLREFRWIAGHPSLPLKIAKALRALQPGVEVVLLNGLDNAAAQQLYGLDSLRVLDFVDPNQHSGEWDPETSHNSISIDAVLNSGLKYLQELSLSGYLAARVNIQRLADSLTRLVICGAGECVGLDIFLRQAHSLVSLSVVDCEDFAFLQSVSTSGEDGFPLSKLQDLKLSLAMPLARDLSRNYSHPRNFLAQARQLARFLALHVDLRRFDFAVEPVRYFDQLASGFDQFDNVEWFGIVLGAVRKLRCLTALGISVPKLPLANLVGINDSLANLPKTCVAVRLTGMSEISYFPIIEEVLCTLPRLSFLCISNWRPLEHIDDWIPLPDVSDLLRLLPNLRLACHNSTFYDVHPSGLNNADFPSWSDERVRFREVKDFPSEDAYWLMAYRFVTKRFFSGPDDPGFEEDDWDHAV